MQNEMTHTQKIFKIVTEQKSNQDLPSSFEDLLEETTEAIHAIFAKRTCEDVKKTNRRKSA